MCNWSDGIVDRVTEKVTIRVTQQVTEQVTQQVTQQVTNKMIISSVENVVNSFHISIEKACEILKYNPAEYYAAKEFCTS
ncbi:MAG: hypothetical protein J6A45_06960 [Lachnospiraceae bacterium]|nr:hypothetical protein [Lachnospiraceae bacterium]